MRDKSIQSRPTQILHHNMCCCESRIAEDKLSTINQLQYDLYGSLECPQYQILIPLRVVCNYYSSYTFHKLSSSDVKPQDLK